MSSSFAEIRQKLYDAEHANTDIQLSIADEEFASLMEGFMKCRKQYEQIIERNDGKMVEISTKLAAQERQINRMIQARKQTDEEKKKCQCVQPIIWASLGTALIGLFVSQFFPKKKTK